MSGHHERGQSMVEFAMVSTVFLMMLFGIIEMGRALYDFHLVSNAARLGSRYAMVRGSDCVKTLAGCSAATAAQIQTYVRSVSPGIPAGSLSVATSWATGTECLGSPFQGAGCTVTVTATYSFATVAPILGIGTIPMSSSSTMVIAQ